MSITILDGGMGQELVARCPEEPTGLWATQYMLDHPDIVRAVHDDYFAAGADVATTNTYAIHRDRLEDKPNLKDRFEELHVMACKIACAARDANGSGLVAGSLGPLGWSYNVDIAPPAEDGAKLYAEIAAIHAPYVDMHILETTSGIEQARAGLMGTALSGKPVWLALSVDDNDGTSLRSGEPLDGVLPLLAEYAPAGVLLNCSTPESIAKGLPIIARAGIPYGAYANGFTSISETFKEAGSAVTKLTSRKDLTPAAYADFTDDWIRGGATLVGGCCETGPAHIAEIARRNKVMEHA